MILPAFGIVRQIVPAFARKRLFGYASMVYATASIAILSFIVVGAPHVHHRHAGDRPAVLHVRDDADRGAHRREGVQLDGHHVARLDDLRDADAVRGRLHLRVHDGRLHRPDPGGRRRSTSSCRTPTTWWRTSTTCWWPARCSRCSPASTTGCRSGPASCTRSARQDPLLGLADLLQPDLLPDALPGPGRHAAPLRRLPDAVRRLQRGRLDRRLRLRPDAGLLPVLVVLPTMRGKGEQAPQTPWEAAEGLEWEVPSPAPFHTFETPPKLNASATRSSADCRQPDRP